MRHLLSLLDWSGPELRENLALARELKQHTRNGACPQLLSGRHYALIFHKNSLRTRVSFEVGIRQLGGSSMILTEQDFKLGERESVADVARVLSRYVDGILIRTYGHEMVEELAQHATVPVVNMLSDFSHPCQIMADALTIEEHLGPLEEAVVTYLGDGNNVTHSWINLAARLPFELRIGTAPETVPDLELVAQAQEAGAGRIQVVHSAQEAVSGANVLYTDVWASMGEKEKTAERRALLRDFQINSDLLRLASPNAIVMHCLPAERGVEITDEVLDGPQSVVWDQAENRLHAQKAILVQLERWRQPS
ncbi:MAG: ornithine carbamoyltransferase [bacterium]|jgi:ornithine carbamoyltransferase